MNWQPWNLPIRLEEQLKGIANLSPPLQKLIEAKLRSGFAGVFTKSELLGMQEQAQLTHRGVMLALLDLAKVYARPPISSYCVGAVCEGASGAVYLGANLEFAWEPLNQSVHAEQAAISLAIGANESHIKSITVSAPPCGHCRQFLHEVDLPLPPLRVQTPMHPDLLVSELLPHAFGPQDLGVKQHPFKPEKQPLRLVYSEKPLDVATQKAVQRALECAAMSHAPYSGAYSGCVIESDDGTLYSGRYLENAAFNPSLSAVQSALVSYNMSGRSIHAAKRVILVTFEDSTISHEDTAKPLLEVISAPKLEVWDCYLDQI